MVTRCTELEIGRYFKNMLKLIKSVPWLCVFLCDVVLSAIGLHCASVLSWLFSYPAPLHNTLGRVLSVPQAIHSVRYLGKDMLTIGGMYSVLLQSMGCQCKVLQ
jgi:hypothetical protein